MPIFFLGNSPCVVEDVDIVDVQTELDILGIAAIDNKGVGGILFTNLVLVEGSIDLNAVTTCDFGHSVDAAWVLCPVVVIVRRSICSFL